jgi:transketolase
MVMVSDLPHLHNPELISRLEKTANRVRREIITMIHHARSGHPGGSLSAADMVTALYFHAMSIDPAHPCMLERDRFILSKGHACPALYAALALRGFFPLGDLDTFRSIDGHLQGHPDMVKTPGVDMTAGPLGNGLSGGVGMALGAQVKGLSFRVYVMLGEGDLQEGCTWEAVLMAGQHHLSNLTALVDYNRSQVDGCTDDIVTLEPLPAKWQAANWAVCEIDGHNMEQIVDALTWAQSVSDRPSAIVAHTIKGKGVSFMENNARWHGKAPGDEEAKLALAELEAVYG